MTLKPYESVRAMYLDHPGPVSFEYYLRWHYLNGFVFSTPNFFAFGRAILKERSEYMVANLVEIDELTMHECDCWYIQAFAGDMRKAWSIMPWPLPWIAFQRLRGGKFELQTLPTESLKRLCPPDEAIAV